MKRVERIFLGNSLTSNTLARENDVIVDIWEGGSDLYGWTLGSSCLDRVPVFLTRKCCYEIFGEVFEEVDVEVVIEGPESGVREKMGDVDSSFLSFCGRLLLPERRVCDCYRSFLRKSKAGRVFSPISRIDLESKTVKTYHRELEYGELVNTRPLHYFLTKAGLSDLSSQLTYASAYILVLVGKVGLREFAKMFIGHRGYSLGLVVSYRETPIGRTVYAFIPFDRKSLRAELTNRAIAELKRLKVIEEPIVFLRSFYSKYFRLRSDAKEIGEFLKKHDVLLAGRYGKWSEVSICDICQ
ncbi:MAG: hypothetical protein RMH84_05145 [Sulfolobales archaeon]|nr:hypothetical protein [Sulfolobales archaeon]MDW8010960.1 hypothetical protein [Sulfolobales archaeon]